MVYQTYETNVNVESVIRGNSVVIRCPIPSYVADYVTVETWLVDQNEIFPDQWGTPAQLKHNSNPFLILSDPAQSCPILPDHARSCLILSDPVLSYPARSCPILPDPV